MFTNNLKIFFTILLFFNALNGTDTTDPILSTTEQDSITTTPACTSNDDLDKAVLGAFSKILVHFAAILQDPKNTAHRNPNLVGIAQAVCSIIMQMFKKQTIVNPQMQELYKDVITLHNVLKDYDASIE